MWTDQRRAVCFIPLVVICLVGSAIYLFSSAMLQQALPDTVPVNAKVIIVYNRVPKSGSSSTNYLFKVLSTKYKKFVFKHSTEFNRRRLSMKERRQLSNHLKASAREAGDRPILYDRHFHFFSIPSTPKTIFRYINVVRDPLKQIVSSFQYRRYKHLKNLGCSGIKKTL